jgi:integrase
MFLVAFRHGLRAAELVDLRWNQVDFGRNAALHVRRAKSGTPSTHPIQGDELRALRQLQREQDPPSSFVFVTERGAPFTTAGFARMIERVGEVAGSGLKVHPHMLRHACCRSFSSTGERDGGRISGQTRRKPGVAGTIEVLVPSMRQGAGPRHSGATGLTSLSA